MRIVCIENINIIKHPLNLYCKKYNARPMYIKDPDEFCNHFICDITEDDIILLGILFDEEGKRDEKGRGYKVLHTLAAKGKDTIPVVIYSVLKKKEIEPNIKLFSNVCQVIQIPVSPKELELALNSARRWKIDQMEKGNV